MMVDNGSWLMMVEWPTMVNKLQLKHGEWPIVADIGLRWLMMMGWPMVVDNDYSTIMACDTDERWLNGP